MDNRDKSEIIRDYEERLKRLHFHAAGLNEAKTIEEIAKHTVDAMATTLGMDASTRTGFDIPGGTFFYVKDDTLFVLGREGQHAELTSVFASQGFPLDGKGLIVRAVKTRETQFVPDVRKDKDFLETPWAEWQTLSELDVPVVIGDQAVAVLSVENPELNRFTEQDKLLLETLASHVASSIQRINLSEAKERYEERLKDLHRHASLLSATNNVQKMADHTIDAMYNILGFGWCHFMIVEEDHLKVISMRGDTSQERKDALKAGEYKLPLNGEGITVRTANLKKAMLVHDVREDPDYVDYAPAHNEYGEPIYASLSELTVPVIANDEVLAVLNTESPNLNEYNEQDQELLETLASHVASAMLRIRAKDAVRDLAYRLNSLKPGGCYLSDSHERCLKAYAILSMQGVPGLCIVREDPQSLVENYGINAEEIVLLSSRPFRDFETISNLQAVSLRISQFLESGRGVVLFDGLEYLITRFGFETVYRFIQEKRFDILESGAVLIVPLDMETLDGREKALLSSEFNMLE